MLSLNQGPGQLGFPHAGAGTDTLQAPPHKLPQRRHVNSDVNMSQRFHTAHVAALCGAPVAKQPCQRGLPKHGLVDALRPQSIVVQVSKVAGEGAEELIDPYKRAGRGRQVGRETVSATARECWFSSWRTPSCAWMLDAVQVAAAATRTFPGPVALQDFKRSGAGRQEESVGQVGCVHADEGARASQHL